MKHNGESVKNIVDQSIKYTVKVDGAYYDIIKK